MIFDAEMTHMKNCLILSFDRYYDHRGFFQEVYNEREFRRLGLPTSWPQDNFSLSEKNVLRGLHIQTKEPQGKLVRCILGSIWDVVVDLRHDSPTFRKHGIFELSEDKNVALYVPPGFAHGFYVTSEKAMIYYKCSTEFNSRYDGGVLWSDPELKIKWPIMENPKISDRDKNLPTLNDFCTRHKQ